MERIFRGARKFGASDIHLVRGIAPVFRVNGEIRVGEGEPLDEATLNRLVDEMITDRQRQMLIAELQLCFSRHWENIGRYRTSIYYHAGTPRAGNPDVRNQDSHGR